MSRLEAAILARWIKDTLGAGELARWRHALGWIRSEQVVLEPARMATALSSNISGESTLVRKIASEKWTFQRLHSGVDRYAGGDLVYRIVTPRESFTFGVRSVVRPDTGTRVGRLRENDFDLYGVIFQGRVGRATLAAEHDEQITAGWKGRTTASALGWSFANRGSRTFERTIECLARGVVPGLDSVLADGGYLVRNAGFYGNGRHGTMPWLSLPEDSALGQPYHLDLLTLYLWKLASFDLVEGAASARSRSATRLPMEFRRAVGVGNSSGIGTIATLVRWPTTLAGMTVGRELALAHGRATLAGESSSAGLGQRLAHNLDARRAEAMVDVADEKAATDLNGQVNRLASRALAGDYRPVQGLLAQNPPTMAASIATSAVIDLDPTVGSRTAPVVGALMRTLVAPRPEMTIAELSAILTSRFAWSFELERRGDVDRTYFWYKSSENGENRRGERAVDPGVEFETFVDVAYAVRRLARIFSETDPGSRVGAFLLSHPELTGVAARVQLAARIPYTELSANLVSRYFTPSDAIRYFLTGLGTRRPKPASDLWLTGVFMSGFSDEVPVEVTSVDDDVPVQGLAQRPMAGVARDRFKVAYPELRRCLLDALRASHVPATMTSEVAELIAWTEAEFGAGLDLVRRLADAERGPYGARLKDGTVDLEGRSLALLGTRLADVVAMAGDGPTTLLIRDARDAIAAPYMCRSLALRGFQASCLIQGADFRQTVVAAMVSGSPAVWIHGPGRRWGATSATVDPVVDAGAELVALELTARRGVAPEEPAAGAQAAGAAADAAARTGIDVPVADYQALLALASRVRVPTSERSRSQAG